jgi:hypothetical protein
VGEGGRVAGQIVGTGDRWNRCKSGIDCAHYCIFTESFVGSSTEHVIREPIYINIFKVLFMLLS